MQNQLLALHFAAQKTFRCLDRGPKTARSTYPIYLTYLWVQSLLPCCMLEAKQESGSYAPEDIEPECFTLILLF